MSQALSRWLGRQLWSLVSPHPALPGCCDEATYDEVNMFQLLIPRDFAVVLEQVLRLWQISLRA